jgi:hypothetical protein
MILVLSKKFDFGRIFYRLGFESIITQAYAPESPVNSLKLDKTIAQSQAPPAPNDPKNRLNQLRNRCSDH